MLPFIWGEIFSVKKKKDCPPLGEPIVLPADFLEKGVKEARLLRAQMPTHSRAASVFSEAVCCLITRCGSHLPLS